MENAIYIYNFKDLRKIDSPKYKFTRIYFGEEFCENRFPDKQKLMSIVEYASKNKLDFTFVTPYVTDLGLKHIEELINIISKSLTSFEVVFNDFGVMKLLHDKYPEIKLVCGRIINKMKRDPRINCALACNNGNLDGEKYFSSTSFLGKYIKELFVRYNVSRIEFDNVYHNFNFCLNDGIHGSLYYPYVFLTTTRLCRLKKDNLFSTKNKLVVANRCEHICNKAIIALDNENINKKIYVYGNTQFLYNKEVKDSIFKNKGMDRLIYQLNLGGDSY